MNALCGCVGEPAPNELLPLLARSMRSNQESHILEGRGACLGYRGPEPLRLGPRRIGDELVGMVGNFVRPVPIPAEKIASILASPTELAKLDGSFAAALWHEARQELRLVSDPFGCRSWFVVEHADRLYFADSLKQLLAIPGLPIAVDPSVIHRYLIFSFVPGEEMPIRGIRRLPPGTIVRFRHGRRSDERYCELRESIDYTDDNFEAAKVLIRTRWAEAVLKRLGGARSAAVSLSGGIDSSGTAVHLRNAGVQVQGFTLDFGAASVEREQACTVAKHLGIPITLVSVSGSELPTILEDLVATLDLPFGDAVTGPHYLLARAAQGAGKLFNGEGGDQFFGGWTNKPMLAASIYGSLTNTETRERQYLRSYHRFLGLEQEAFTPEFLAQRTESPEHLLAPYLHSPTTTFLHRLRLADLHLKGSFNIIPRVGRIAERFGLDLQMPMFDRAFGTAALRLAPNLKLRGASEKYILKCILHKELPIEIIHRPKFGMCVPITDWVLGPMREFVHDLLSPSALARRGWLRPEYVAMLLRGEDVPDEIRRRRIGERLWTLVMLELWLRTFID